jgi:hypothetical protein
LLKKLLSLFELTSLNVKVMIERINLLDTEYAEILANSPNPGVEIRLIQMGVNPNIARRKTNFLTLVQHKPTTPEEWQVLTTAWKEAYGYSPDEDNIALISKLVWEKSPH